MKKQAFNPYLPSWEYIPDGEPHVYGDRVYVYGSHDFFNGYVFCMGDYMGWSAPVSDLSDWRCEGVIFPRDGDPANADGKMCLYAPDVTRGPDGRWYLYSLGEMLMTIDKMSARRRAGGPMTEEDRRFANQLGQISAMLSQMERAQNGDTDNSIEAQYSMYLDLPKGFTETLNELVVRTQQRMSETGSHSRILGLQHDAADTVATFYTGLKYMYLDAIPVLIEGDRCYYCIV